MSVSPRITVAAGAATALGAAPIGSTFRDQVWIFYAWAVVAVLTVINLVARRFRVTPALVMVIDLAALMMFVTVTFSRSHALLGFLPTPTSISDLGDVWESGRNDLRFLIAPVPAHTGLLLFATIAVGLVAIVVDTIAAGIGRPAVAGLVLLVLYAVPTAIAFNGVGWFPFALAALGYLILLLADGHDQILRWGRVVPYDDRPGERERSWPLRPTGRRVGVAALAMAVLVPTVIPGLNSNAITALFRDDGDDGTGTQGGAALNPFTKLRENLTQSTPQVVMEVTTDQDEPFYIRQIVLDQISESGGWSESVSPSGGENLSGDISLVPGTNGFGTRFTAQFSIRDGQRDSTLPMLGVPREADVSSDWRYVVDRNEAFSSESTIGGMEYTETYLDPRPTEGQLRDTARPGDEIDLGRWLALPTLPNQVSDTVETLTQGLTDPYERTMAIYDYFLAPDSGFRYSLTTRAGTSGNALLDFLETKQGFCQQYASAMGVMLRLANIPARVVIGYTPGHEKDGVREVTTRDAHAWVEAYFNGVGWVPFDPTPLPGGRRVERDYALPPGVDPTPTTTTPSGTVSPGQTAGNGEKQLDLSTDPVSDSAEDSRGVVSPRSVGIGVGGLAVLLLAFSPLLARRGGLRRRLRAAAGPDPVAGARGAWDEVAACAEDYGVPLRATETPRASARRLASDLSLPAPAAAALRVTALAEERARYAADPGVDADLPTSIRAVRGGLRATASRWRRIRATLAPSSVLAAVRVGVLARLADAMAVADRVASAVRRPFSTRRRR